MFNYHFYEVSFKYLKKKVLFYRADYLGWIAPLSAFKWIGRERYGGNRKRLVHKEFPLPEQSREIYIFFLSEGFNDTFKTEEKKTIYAPFWPRYY